MSNNQTIYEKLEQIESAEGTNNKKETLLEVLHYFPEIEHFLRKTYDTTIYGISSKSIENILDYSEKNHGVYYDPGNLILGFAKGTRYNSWAEIQIFLKSLYEKTGNAQLDWLKQLTYLPPLQAKWITRLILKDLKLGISLISINEVLKKSHKAIINKFEVQLAGKIDSPQDYKEGYPVYASVKYDGERAWLIRENGQSKLISRQGKTIDYIPEILEIDNLPDNCIIDGEILCDTFSELQQRIGRKADNINKINSLHFRVFDIVQWEGEDLKNKSQQERYTYFDSLPEHKYLQKEETRIIYCEADLHVWFRIVVDRGEEGLILKMLDRPYVLGSRKNWIKIKPIYENTFRIIDKKYGTGKNAGLISTIIITDASGKISSGVGSGLTENDILLLMNLDRDNKLINTCVDVAYNEITVNKFGAYSLRHPRVLKIRLDKDEADTIETGKK